MIAVFILGLTGSLGHCATMCGGVSVLLARRGVTQGWHWVGVQLGRLYSYCVLGALAGWFGQSVIGGLGGGSAGHDGHDVSGVTSLGMWQGGLALFTAVLAFYMALAMLGRVPSLELMLVRFTRLWGRLMRRLTVQTEPRTLQATPLTAFGLGIAWGFLPCGLVLAALLAAAVAGSPLRGGMTMLVFGLGTLPLTWGITLLARRPEWRTAVPQLRLIGATAVVLFGVQMSLRGLAMWGWVSHLHLGGVMLW
ncbi:MAG: sulfite exporter TauE/SafE family protein [Ardenticatenaceae bacterium]|nr:sulfite exporter TauE/SafE family protein [Anaerolineales bacterium]MCB8937455.1 sulfite exporter TauE/SafE family protein [Ardenticatenaceae bacterium]MCB8975564.1 sulfite exporter TauE/SafE family protein [Ardenticatenaceae bacterium]